MKCAISAGLWRPRLDISMGLKDAVDSPLSCRSNFQLHANLFLKCAQYSEEICSAGISGWAQHSVQALAGNSYERSEFFEADGGIDEIFEDGFANRFFAAEIRIERFRQQRLSECGITLGSRISGFSKILR
jgi:hypothetical protein